jgi:hypothetical protein
MAHGPLLNWNKDKNIKLKNIKIFLPISLILSSIIIFVFLDYKNIILFLGLIFSIY